MPDATVPAESDSQSIRPDSSRSLVIPSSVRSVVSSFYTLVDTNSSSAFHSWTNLFTDDGSIEIGKKKKAGPDELFAERAQSWDKIASRKHHMKTVYVRGASETVVDLVVLGWVDIEVRGNGVRFSQEFAQRFLIVMEDGDRNTVGQHEKPEPNRHDIEGERGTDWRIRMFQAWIVSRNIVRTCTRDKYI